MCRMLLYLGTEESKFSLLLKSLEDVSRNDPLHDYERKPFLDHRDGWGYVDSGPDFLSYNRYLAPIFESAPKHFSGDMRILHARNATEGEPKSLLSTQPLHLQLPEDDVYLSHNGWLDKSKLCPSCDREFLDTRSDSETFLHLMSQMEGSLVDRFRTALERVYEADSLLSGLNIFLLAISRKSKERLALVYSDAREFNLYHRFFHLNGDSFSAVVSSSIPESVHFPNDLEKISLSPGIIYSMKKGRIETIAKISGCRNAEGDKPILLK